MNPTHSLRWRIQLWHGALLAALLVALGVAADRYRWTSELRRVDAELRERVAMLSDSLPIERGRRPPPPFGGFPGGGPPPGERPGPPDFKLPPERAALFDPQKPGAPYYVLWRRDGVVLMRSPGAPADVPKPERASSEAPIATDRTRGELREAFAFTPPGECLLAGRSLAPEIAAQRQYARALAGIGAFVFALALGGGWWATTRALRPLGAIAASAGRVAEGRLDERIAVRESAGELGQLATVLNATFAKLEAAFDRQARFTADAAHELRTPVSVVISQAQLGLRGERSAAEYREALEACLRAARRMQKLTQSLLELAQHDAGAIALQRTRCDLADLARETADLLQATATERGVTLALALSPAPCDADADRLAQVLLNLLTNALDHTPAGGRVVLATSADATHATVSVADTGPGIAAEHLPHLFDRFYRADTSRNRRTGGAGLGLAICKAIADAHGGTLTVASTAGQGSTFTLRVPVASASPATASHTAATSEVG